MKKYKQCKVGDYVWFIRHPYELECEGIVIKVADISTVKVAVIDDDDMWISTSDITQIK